MYIFFKSLSTDSRPRCDTNTFLPRLAKGLELELDVMTREIPKLCRNVHVVLATSRGPCSTNSFSSFVGAFTCLDGLSDTCKVCSTMLRIYDRTQEPLAVQNQQTVCFLNTMLNYI